jgi:hypothetical protein
MFPFCSHPKSGSQLAYQRGVAVGDRPNSSPKGRYKTTTVTLGGLTKMTVMGVPRIACVVLMLAATEVS